MGPTAGPVAFYNKRDTYMKICTHVNTYIYIEVHMHYVGAPVWLGQDPESLESKRLWQAGLWTTSPSCSLPWRRPAARKEAALGVVFHIGH